jgi:hypothetical protein
MCVPSGSSSGLSNRSAEVEESEHTRPIRPGNHTPAHTHCQGWPMLDGRERKPGSLAIIAAIRRAVTPVS